jgi:hypothetical protein
MDTLERSFQIWYLRGDHARTQNRHLELTTFEYEFCLDNAYSFQESFNFPVLLKIPGKRQCFQIQGGNPLVDISDDASLSAYNIIDLPRAGSSDFYSIDDTI